MQLELLRNTYINVLSVNWGHHSKLLLSFDCANVLLVHKLVWLPFEIGPLGILQVSLSKDLSETPSIFMVLNV